MLKKFLASFLFLIFIVVSIYTNIGYAVVEVTDENLNEAFQSFISSDSNDENYSVSISNNIITMSDGENSYSYKYDLTDQPTFTYEVPIEQGMSYAEFEDQAGSMLLTMYGYIAVANIQGATLEDAAMYFLLSYLGAALENSEGFEPPFTIIDDLSASEGVTIEKEDDPSIIYTSEFGERVMEYVNVMYKDKQTIADTEGINSYEITVERRDVTETSCNLVCELKVNLEADFASLEEYAEDDDSFKDKADYVVTLKEGQTCEFQSNEKITGYAFAGGNAGLEISEDYTELIAKKAGTKNVTLYVGDDHKQIFIYVIVEENQNNEVLNSVILKIDETVEEEPKEDEKDDSNENEKEPVNDDEKQDIKDDPKEEAKEEEKKEEKPKDENKKDEQVNIKDPTVIQNTILPQTGLNSTVFVIIILLIIFSIVMVLKLKEYKDVK